MIDARRPIKNSGLWSILIAKHAFYTCNKILNKVRQEDTIHSLHGRIVVGDSHRGFAAADDRKTEIFDYPKTASLPAVRPGPPKVDFRDLGILSIATKGAVCYD